MTRNTRQRVSTPENRLVYLERMLKALCTDLGPHPSGTKAYEKATQILHREMAAALPVAFRDRYLDRWEAISPEIIHRSRRLSEGVAENCAGTSDAGFTGVITKLKKGRVPYGIVDAATGDLTACINVSNEVGALPEYLVGEDVLSLPRFVIGLRDVPFVDLLVKDRAKVQVRLRVVYAPPVPTYNVVGTIPGESPEEIIIVAHADSLIMTEGANDNTATAIIITMLAHAFSGTRPRRTLTFLIPGSEEYGLLGAKHYVRRRETEGTLRNLRFVINCDSLTFGPNLWASTTDAGLIDTVKAIHADLGLGTDPIYSPDQAPWMNDASCFRPASAWARGINFNSRGYATLAANHTPDDNAANVPRDCAESSFLVLRELIERMQEL